METLARSPLEITHYSEYLKRNFDPLPLSTTSQRLLDDGILDVGTYLSNLEKTEAYIFRMEEYRKETLVISWNEFPDSFWAVNVEGRLVPLDEEQTYFPPDGWDTYS